MKIHSSTFKGTGSPQFAEHRGGEWGVARGGEWRVAREQGTENREQRIENREIKIQL